MAVLSHTIQQKVVTAARSVVAEKTYSGDAETTLSISIPDATTDQQVNVSVDVSAIQSVFMTSDQDLTVETNNAGTPIDTINLKANVPYLWTSDSYFANLLTADVTALFLTNASGNTAAFEMEVVYDSTP